jgi:glyoxylate reductase
MPSTPKKKPLVIVTRKLPDAIETRLMELFDTRLNADDKPLTGSQLVEALKTADVLVPTVTDRIDAGVLSTSRAEAEADRQFRQRRRQYRRRAAPPARHHRDQHAGVLTEDTADMTMALILAVPRRLAEGERS